MIMAHEIGHVLGLAHGNVEKDPNGNSLKLWKVSTYDKDSIMHTYFDPAKKLTHADCHTLSFHNKNFKEIKCGFVGEEEERCKNVQRTVLKLKDVVLNKKEVLVDTRNGRGELMEDVADYTCLGSAKSKYILNDPYIQDNFGFFQPGVVLTQCLGVRLSSDPDHIYVLQSDGNFVSYNSKTGKAVWSTQSQGRGTKGDYSIFFQTDGDLIIYDINGVATWSSASHFGSPDAFRLKVASWQFRDGHMYLSDSAGRAVWGIYPAFAHQDVPIQQKDRDGGASGYCLDAGTTDNSQTYLNVCNGRDNQPWNIFTDGTIRSKCTGKCLFALYNGNEAQVNMNPCFHYGNAKLDARLYQWQVRGDGTIVNRAINRCLDNRSQQLKVYNPIQIYECFEVWSEKWWIGGIP
ncbi:hypothetical protein BG015_003278 [Linnemannia schmuckeri]|uniref:Bulb-type lectin domain-containing protein n=1 Tax=Linnemannia schmuckeri TaxID=64567 RepID=A0A9P5S607_9FUNG|nr:hypothetical protein BG015_003278 [Linnemannia schmuckeri]